MIVFEIKCVILRSKCNMIIVMDEIKANAEKRYLNVK